MSAATEALPETGEARRRPLSPQGAAMATASTSGGEISA